MTRERFHLRVPHSGLICHMARRLFPCRVLLLLVLIIFSWSANSQDICTRTAQVQTAILALFPDLTDCELVSSEHLNQVARLDLSSKEIDNLDVHDFRNLVNLIDLNLGSNRLRGLPESIFSDLHNVNNISLRHNALNELRPGVFSNLPELRNLDLAENQITQITDVVFSDLPKFTYLNLQDNRITYMSAYAFQTIPSLTSLAIDRSELDKVPFTAAHIVKSLHLDSPVSAFFFRDPQLGSEATGGTTAAGSVAQGTTIEFRVRSSRLFAAPNQYPPRSFAAYGLVAFRSLATKSTLDRYINICEGYVASLLHYTELVRQDVQTSEQMATVWPLTSETLADNLNSRTSAVPNECQDIVMHTNLVISQNAIRTAEAQLTSPLSGNGPYLLAWSPASNAFEEDALVLSLNFSDVNSTEQALKMFDFWITEIEKDAELWNDGWNWERIRLKAMLAVDKIGSGILELFGA